MSKGWSTHMVAALATTNSTPCLSVTLDAPKVCRPLTRKLKTMPAEVDTKLATTMPSGALSTQNSTRSISVLQTPTARKRTTVREIMVQEYAANLRRRCDVPVSRLAGRHGPGGTEVVAPATDGNSDSDPDRVVAHRLTPRSTIMKTRT